MNDKSSPNSGAERMAAYARIVASAPVGMKAVAWRPLTSWPSVQHPREAEIQQFKAMPSRGVSR